MTEQQQNEINAVKILAVASDGYLNSLDELGKNFITPQVRAAMQIVANIVSERNPEPAPEAQVVPEPEAETKKK